MSSIRSAQEEFTTRIANRMEELESAFATMIRNTLKRNDVEIQARIERAKKSVAEKGRAVEQLLEEAPEAGPDRWPRLREDLDGAWVEYREAVDRARLEPERVSELS